jgi:predicted secreted protein
MNKLIISLTLFTFILFNFSINNFANTFEVTKDDNNSTIKISKNDSITINLEGNITTGYSWVLLDDYDSNLLSLSSNDYQENPAEGKLGNSGNFVFTFESINSGETELNFSYCQPWNKNNSDDNFNIKVSIEENSDETSDNSLDNNTQIEDEETQSSQNEESYNENSSNEPNSNISDNKNTENTESEKSNNNETEAYDETSSEYFNFIIEMLVNIINIAF